MYNNCNILAFETATQVCSVALYANGKIFFRIEKTPKRSSEVLLLMINHVLAEADISINQLNLIAIGYGPGSFMGVRLAVGVAKGIAFPRHIPVIGVSTLQILAQTAFEKFQLTSVLAAWDARMHEMYVGIYRLNREKIMCAVEEDELIKPSRYILPKGAYRLVGNAWSVYYADFSSIFKKQFDHHAAEIAWMYPDAISLLRIASHRYRNKQYTNALNLSPVYLRDKVAETSA